MFAKVIPQGHCAIVERFGRPVRTVNSGLHFFLPYLDHFKDVMPVWGEETNKKGIFIELSVQDSDTQPRNYFTKDNVSVTTDCRYTWRITDPVKAVYEVDHLHKSLQEAVLNEIRSFIGSHDLNYILTARMEISAQIVAGVADNLKSWGCNLISAEIQEITTDDATVDAMRQEMEAMRRGKAAKLEADGKADALLRMAEAEKRAAILKAEGEKEALALIAQGDRDYIQSLSEAIGNEQAMKILIAQKSLQAYSAISGNSANKVFMPPPAAASMLMLDEK